MGTRTTLNQNKPNKGSFGVPNGSEIIGSLRTRNQITRVYLQWVSPLCLHIWEILCAHIHPHFFPKIPSISIIYEHLFAAFCICFKISPNYQHHPRGWILSYELFQLLKDIKEVWVWQAVICRLKSKWKKRKWRANVSPYQSRVTGIVLLQNYSSLQILGYWKEGSIKIRHISS